MPAPADHSAPPAGRVGPRFFSCKNPAAACGVFYQLRYGKIRGRIRGKIKRRMRRRLGKRPEGCRCRARGEMPERRRTALAAATSRRNAPSGHSLLVGFLYAEARQKSCIIEKKKRGTFLHAEAGLLRQKNQRTARSYGKKTCGQGQTPQTCISRRRPAR